MPGVQTMNRLLPISIGGRNGARAGSEPVEGQPVSRSPVGGRSPRSDRFRLIQTQSQDVSTSQETSRASSPGVVDGGDESGRASRLAGEADEDEDTDVFDDLEDEARPVIEAPALVTPTALTSPGSPWPFTADRPGFFASLRRTRTGTLTQISSPELVPTEAKFTPADLPQFNDAILSALSDSGKPVRQPIVAGA